MVSTMRVSLYVTAAAVAGFVGGGSVATLATTKATVEAQTVVSCPAPPAPDRRGFPEMGTPPPTTGYKQW